MRTPKIDLEFEDVEEAWEVWSKYIEKVGFGVRKQFKNKQKKDGVITSYRYACYNERIRKLGKRDGQVTKHRAKTKAN
ncbi:hypothetical protein HKD37_19G055122 [Glycine soja]